ncbi:MAG: hypothetical protein KAJ62_12075 [Desulfobacteraceae bacterium]|nr:hypothetical protein [Desulfobacteraceae bacterium]
MKKLGFVKKCWWGIFCILLFTVLIVVGCLTGTTTESSDKFGGIVFFAKYSQNHSIRIQKPPAKFSIFVDGGPSIFYDKKIMDPDQNSPYIIQKAEDSITIESLDLSISQKMANDIWQHDPVVVTEHQDGSIEYEAGYDAPMVLLTGVYTVNNNIVYDHYFKIISLALQIMGIILIVPLYLSGKIVIFIFRWFKKRNV